MPGEAGVRCDCHSIAPPISSGSRLNGSPSGVLMLTG